jgi:hypothetical protein
MKQLQMFIHTNPVIIGPTDIFVGANVSLGQWDETGSETLHPQVSVYHGSQ